MLDIVIVTGGTGGHIFPARSLAKALRQEGFSLAVLADSNYLKYHQASDNYSYKIISASKLAKGIYSFPRSCFNILTGVFTALKFLLFHKPRLVIAFGGYASFPVLLASFILRKRIILHEQNAHLGKVNRLFAKFAYLIALSYEKTEALAPSCTQKAIYTGNPIREEISRLNQLEYQLPDLEKKEHFNILVLGGSGGAKIFSEILPKAFFNLNETLKKFLNITQQCRPEYLNSTREQYKAYGLQVMLSPFFEDIEEQIKKAHLIIARAGSSSIAEFTAAKKPLILIPFALASDDHQAKNAAFLENKGAAIVLKERELTATKFSSCLEKLLGDFQALEEMSRASSACANLRATENLASLVRRSLGMIKAVK